MAAKRMRAIPGQGSLFEALPPTEHRDWRPSQPPDLTDINDIIVDVETTGLRWWGGDTIVGIAIGWIDKDGAVAALYLPCRHVGGNLDEGKLKEWARHQLRNKRLITFNGAFDVLMFYVWGIDLEQQGCTITDVSHYAALLDDHQRNPGLDLLGQQHLGYGKVKGLDMENLEKYHAAEVAPYGGRDIVLTGELYLKLWPEVERQKLKAVAQLEDDCIYVTCEMMRNGAPIDEEKLHRWANQAAKDEMEAIWQLYKTTGLKLNPGSTRDAQRLFDHLHIPPPTVQLPGKDFGKITFAKRELRRIGDPTINLFAKARALGSIRSKYLDKYIVELQKGPVLRYALHQLPVDDEGGTISGRYSSSGWRKLGEGINIQQVSGKKHLASLREDEALSGYKIRELFIPEKGKLWLSSDAEQIEYRLFAHYAQPPGVLKAYAENPRTDFHAYVMDQMIKPIFPDITRERTKDSNFAAIYMAGPKKQSFMLGISLAEAKRFMQIYHKAFPEARELGNKAMKLAEERGYVKTLLGRIARFRPEDVGRAYSALNRVIQGSAADVMKRKLVELHKARRNTGLRLRFTVHDEVNGDIPNKEAAERVRDVLDAQSFPTRVPLLWSVGVGANWQEAK